MNANPLIPQTILACIIKLRYIKKNQLCRAYYEWWLLVDQIYNDKI